MKIQPKEFIVYIVTNSVNGKKYIGATRKGIEGRKRQHFKDYKRKGKTRDCPRFYDAIRKYGQDAFEWATLATLSTADEMYKEEERLIALLKPEYNIASGGLIFTSKEKQKKFLFMNAQRFSKKIICLNDGAIYPSINAAERAYGIQALSQMCKREGISRDGLSFAFLESPMSAMDRERILNERRSRKSASELERVKKVANIISRQVTCLNTGIIFPSAMDAEKAMELGRSVVSYLCRTGKTNREGFCFAFGALTAEERLLQLEAAKNKSQQTKREWKQNLSKSRWKASWVRCDTYGTIFSSAEAAQIEYCIAASSIREVCNGRNKMTFGLKFSYI